MQFIDIDLMLAIIYCLSSFMSSLVKKHTEFRNRKHCTSYMVYQFEHMH